MNEELKHRSGNVSSDDKLVCFLYLLLRDHLLPGDIEALLKNADGDSFEFTNGYLASYSKDLAARLDTQHWANPKR